MAKETSDAAILQLRAKALEQYGLIKDTYARPAEEGDVEKAVNHALKLAQFEGAMLTLQQYFGHAEQPPAPPPEPERPPMVVTEEMSPTLRRTNSVKKKHAPRKKKVEESE
tara:strand:+ start:40415 stop:40747 length:333 start_codon:yes stop_codon:yes gene_type:complete